MSYHLDLHLEKYIFMYILKVTGGDGYGRNSKSIYKRREPGSQASERFQI